MSVDYSTLVAGKTTDGSIRQWLNEGSAPATIILDMAEQEIWKKLRVREMRTITPGTLTLDDDTEALPSNFRQPLQFMITGIDKAVLAMKPPEEVQKSYLYDHNGDRLSNKPKIFFCDGSNINFDSPPDKAYTYSFLHLAALAPLSGDNTTNILTTRYLTLLMAGCLWAGAVWAKRHEEAPGYLQALHGLIEEANEESGVATTWGMTLASVAG